MGDSKRLIRRGNILATLADTTGGRMARLDRVADLMVTDPGVLEGLGPSEFYFLLKDLGPRDAAPLLAGATDEHLGRLLDFEAWEGPSFAPVRFTAWLELAAGEDEEIAVRMLRAADPEALVLQVMKQARIIEVDKTPDQVDVYQGRDDTFQTPDGDFWVISEIGAGAMPNLKHLVDLLYTTDLEWARETLKASAWELASSLEDEALRFRLARLGEEGFPSPDEAERIYKIVDMKKLRGLLEQQGDQLRAGKSSAQTRALWDLGGVEGFDESLLTRALATMRDGPRKASIVRSLAHLLGEVVMAETKGDFSDAEGAARAPERLHGFVSAGVAHLGASTPEEAAGLLRRLHPRILFRAGYTLLLGIRQRARECLRSAGAAQGFRLLDETPWGPALDSAAAFVPRIHGILDAPGNTTPREIQGLDDIVTLRGLVRGAATRLKFVTETLGADVDTLSEWIGEQGRAHVTCTTVVATALFDAVADLSLVTPLTPAQISSALDLWMPWDATAQRRIPDGTVHDSLVRRMGDQSDAVARLVNDAVNRIQEVFGGLEPGSLPDPRYHGSVVLLGVPV